MVVAGGVYRLGQVDDDRAIAGEQDVEFGQVAVDDAGAEHAYHLAQQRLVVNPRFVLGEHDVVEPGCRISVSVRHEVHQQHAVAEVARRRYAHAGGEQPVQCIDFGRLPGGFLGFAAEARAARHRPRHL